jgi:uncharacterized repeat protein (TIGR03803 family)
MRRNGRSGALTTALLLVSTLLLLLAAPANGKTKFRTLYRFMGGIEGSGPQAGLVFDSAGNLYGTTTYGGAQESGTVFELTRQPHGKWTESVLYSFCSLPHCTDGSAPTASLIFDSSGNLYGTTTGGGANYTNTYAGTVFKLTPGSDGKWTESVLYSFCSLQNCADGSLPQAALVFDSNGTLYSTTRIGGAYNRGTAFQLAPQQGGGWTEDVIYSFCSCGDGEIPIAPLIFDAIGNLYGTTFYPDGTTYGAVFELSPGSGGIWSESVLYSFPDPSASGAEPWAGLAFDQAGNLYGTAWGAGKPGCNSYGCGGVFQLTPNGTGGWEETTLHLFTDGLDGATPLAGVTLDNFGNVYGTAAGGGELGAGVVYKLAHESGGWHYRVLHAFGTDGEPEAGLILDGAGNLYGTTYGQYVNRYVNHGSVFKLTP